MAGTAGSTMQSVVVAMANAAQLVQQQVQQVLLGGAHLLGKRAREEAEQPHFRRVYPRPDYQETAWARMLREDELMDPSSRAAKKFRRQFRVPYPFFKDLVMLVREHGWLHCGDTDAAGRRSAPLELKVLAVLQILGRGNCMQDVELVSGMSESTISRVFDAFCESFALHMYDSWIAPPAGTDLERVMEDFRRLGFSGAIGSTDVTHVPWDKTPHAHTRYYTGKEGFPTLAYQVTVDHSGRIMATTQGFPGARNDKTIVRYDTFVTDVRTKDVYTNREYQLVDADGQEYSVRGVYLLVDGGYHKWRCLQCPTKHPTNFEEHQWCKYLESVRKDVECCFGKLKGRFRILKLPLQYHSTLKIDNVFFTCCILHNMLHAFDGLGALEAGAEWSGADGNHEPWLAEPSADFGRGGAAAGAAHAEETLEVEGTFQELRRQLVAHFTYKRAHGEVQWLVHA